MKYSCLALLILCVALSGCAGEGPCVGDAESVLALDYRAFDQDIPRGGWRGVSRREECKAAAADLIATYIERHSETLNSGELRILNWHEGQMRASAGDYAPAAALFAAAKHDPEDDSWDKAWNLYADASIAFVERDRDALTATHEAMLELPEPPDWADYQKDVEAMGMGPSEWPQNRKPVEQLLACFNKSYSEAYGNERCKLSEQ